jgi:hypothetical protein
LLQLAMVVWVGFQLLNRSGYGCRLGRTAGAALTSAARWGRAWSVARSAQINGCATQAGLSSAGPVPQRKRYRAGQADSRLLGEM